MLLYIVRHGDPIFAPESLTERGKLQVAAVAKRLARYGVDKIYTSPMNRARQTAKPTCDLLNRDAEILPWVSEEIAWKYFTCNDGQVATTWCFRTENSCVELRSPEIEKLGKEWYKAEYFRNKGVRAEEGYKYLRAESDAFLASLGYEHDPASSRYKIVRHNEDRVAVFCHQGLGLSWLGVLLDIPLPITWTAFDISHSDLTVIHFADHPSGYTVPMMLTLSNDSHLYAEGLPTRYQNTFEF